MKVVILTPPKIFNSYETYLLVGTTSYKQHGKLDNISNLTIGSKLQQNGYDVVHIDAFNDNLTIEQTRKVLFGLITVLVIPALFFTTLEMVLRLSGYGKSYDYFAEIKINGRSYYQDNPQFIEQFYPAALNLTPLENTFSPEKPDDLIRIFILGGSAARGFPNPSHGFSRLLETQLRQALPGMRVEVINTSMTAVNSHVVYEIAKSIPEGAADFAIVLIE